jgi:prophage antirepressor-like protein
MKIEIFECKGRGVRAVTKSGDPWFVAKDVCECLELGNVSEAVKSLDKEDLTSAMVMSGGQNRRTILANESGLYDLIFKSRKPEARAFKRWVTKEVLPTIRKTGSFNGKFVPATREQMRQYALEELAEAVKPVQIYGSVAKDGRPRIGWRSPTFTVKGRLGTAKLVAAMRMQLELPLLANIP